MSTLTRKLRIRNSVAFFVITTSFACNRSNAAQLPTTPRSRPKIVHSFPINKFYETADPLPAGKAGELIRSAEFDLYDLPGDVSAVRIVYHSLSANNEDIPVSGVVLFPDKKPPIGGWPVIAWAHDLNGVARTCAPSLQRNLRNGSFLSMYVQLGYAVVATDYAGQGAKGGSAFVDMNSNATDVIYSVPAARKAVPQLGARWVAMGTGEGAMAVVAVAQRELHDPDYLGSIAISGLQELKQEYASLKDVPSQSLLNLAYGVQTVYPKFQVSEILNAKGMSLYGHIGTECTDGEVSSAPAAELVNPKWERNSFVQSYFSRNRPGLSPTQAPLLVLSSDGDPRTAEISKIVSRLCAAGGKVQFMKNPGNDPAALIGDSVRDQIQWIQGVFANRPPLSDCSTQR